MNARTRKVQTIVLGRGLAAAALAVLLAGRGQRVALLVEEPGWETGLRPAWASDHPLAIAAEWAEAGAALLAEWQTEGVPGIVTWQGEGGREWRLDLDQVLPALGAIVAGNAGSWCAVGTHVRGISVIEGVVLGAIAEDARYDARQVVNAAEDARHAALARMMRQPVPLDLYPFTPTATEVTADLLLNPFPRDRNAPLLAETTVRGAWRVAGIAGWPLLALGAAVRLAERLGAGEGELL